MPLALPRIAPRLNTFLNARAFSSTGTGKRQSHGLKLEFWTARMPFPRQAEGKGNSNENHHFQPDCLFLDQHGEKGTLKLKTRVLDALGLQKRPCSDDFGRHLGSLAIAFSPCLSRKRHFQGPPRRPNTVPLPTILDASFGSSRLPLPPACRGKCYFRAPWECSRWPFPPACRGKGLFSGAPCFLNP